MDIEENVLRLVQETLSLSMQVLLHQIGISFSNIWRILSEN